jgi:ABC-type multidrug transport system fused ATPase/permease subunit
LLLLDEPTAHLDQKTQDLVLSNLFEESVKNKQTVLMVAHRLETAVTFCDKILVLEKGEVVQFDKPLSLLLSNVSDQVIN